MALPAAPLSIAPAPAAGSSGRAFVDFDERLVSSDARSAQPGVVIVRAPLDVHAAIMAHTARRLRRSGWAPVDASGVSAAHPAFREIATQLGLGVVSSEPQACAEAIALAAFTKRSAIILSLPKDGSWDRAVATELVRSARTLVIFVTTGDLPAWEAGPTVSTFELAGELTGSDKLRWMGAIAEEAQRDVPTHDMRALEAWWAKARRSARSTAAEADAIDGVTESGRAILSCLSLAGRSLPSASLVSLGDDALSAIDELVDAGLVTRNGVLVSISATCDARALEALACDGSRLATAQILAGGPGFDPDPWAFARAAELLLGAGSVEASDAAIAKAVRGMDDSHAANEITNRWFAAVAPHVGEPGLFLRLQGAQRALGMGEANDAQRWCESATSLKPQDPTIALLMGRSLMQLGDIVSARVSLQRAQAAAGDDELRARVAAELAELSYLSGDLTGAAENAKTAIALATTPSTHLAGRNTLGKINLTEAKWDAADEHFAADALTASAAGDGTAELRARLNRGIALMSKGVLDDARVILVRVLDDAETMGEDRARAYAYANLGVIASRQHDYAAALSYWEQAIRFRHTLRGRIASTRTIANLAELRLRLGLIDHAEHAIAFGRRILRGRIAAPAAAHYGIVSARIALARGNSALARREIDAAIADANNAGEKGDFLPDAWLVSARVALDDGDLHRAAEAIVEAAKVAVNVRGRAEVAILRALHMRALGQNAIDTATEALQLARGAAEEDLLGETYALLAMLYRDAGDMQAAQAHCCRATAVRDQVATGLPGDIRAAFLAKPEIVALSRLQSSLVREDSEVEEEAPRTLRSDRPMAGTVIVSNGPAREIIGDDAAIRSLLIAIRKVARSNSTILIRGESGTGKELVADALHRASDRGDGPLVSVNCAALVETLLLSELFGHEKGAFTGASSRRRGRFEMAEGGTLFLDEIGDISARTQVALLRVLQEKTFERVGGTQPIRANVRVVCATHRDLKAMVERGEFREDLYYRLKGITLEVPGLRARLGDLPKIAEHLLSRIATERGEKPKAITQDAIELLQRHRWPGNIRELENVLRAVSLFAEGESIEAGDLIDNVEDLRTLAQSGPASFGAGASQAPMSLRPSLVPAPAPSAPLPGDGDEDGGDGALPDVESGATAVAYAQVRQGSVSLSDMKRQIERDCIARALEETKGNITRAATLLGMKRPRLSQLVKQYGLSAASSEGSQ